MQSSLQRLGKLATFSMVSVRDVFVASLPLCVFVLCILSFQAFLSVPSVPAFCFHPAFSWATSCRLPIWWVFWFESSLCFFRSCSALVEKAFKMLFPLAICDWEGWGGDADAFLSDFVCPWGQTIISLWNKSVGAYFSVLFWGSLLCPKVMTCSFFFFLFIFLSAAKYSIYNFRVLAPKIGNLRAS